MDENTIEIKNPKTGRTKASIRQAIESELTEAKVKEAKTKLKQLVSELAAAKAVVRAKEAEIDALFEDYADIIPE
jgi:hypothetical protein